MNTSTIIRKWAKDRAMRQRCPEYVGAAERWLLATCEAEGWTTMGRITTARLRGWLEREAAKGLAAHTINNRLGLLGSWLRWAWRNEIINTQPMRLEPIPNRSPTRRRALTGAELSALLGCPEVPEERRNAYRLLVYTALRRGELAWTLRACRDAPQGSGPIVGEVLALPATVSKSRKAETLPLSPEAVELIGRVRNVPTSRQFARDCKAAGIVRVDGRGQVLVLHSLRATANSLMAAAGVPVRTRAAVLRHGDARLTDGVYLDEAALDTRAAVGLLGREAGKVRCAPECGAPAPATAEGLDAPADGTLLNALSGQGETFANFGGAEGGD